MKCFGMFKKLVVVFKIWNIRWEYFEGNKVKKVSRLWIFFIIFFFIDVVIVGSREKLKARIGVRESLFWLKLR